MSAVPIPQMENNFPDCVAMKLHIQDCADNVEQTGPLSSGQEQCSSPPKTYQLSLTASFSGEQKVEVPGGSGLGLPGGKISFGASRGELRFKFLNCKMPLEKIVLLKPLNISVEVERQLTSSSELQAGATLEGRNIGARMLRGSSEKRIVQFFQVKKIGGEKEPAWIFEACDSRTVLEGTISETVLGVIDIDCFPCEMTVNYTVRGCDIKITWGEIGSVKDINRNKLAVIERAIALRYIKPLLESNAVCKGSWKHG